MQKLIKLIFIPLILGNHLIALDTTDTIKVHEILKQIQSIPNQRITPKLFIAIGKVASDLEETQASIYIDREQSDLTSCPKINRILSREIAIKTTYYDEIIRCQYDTSSSQEIAVIDTYLSQKYDLNSAMIGIADMAKYRGDIIFGFHKTELTVSQGLDLQNQFKYMNEVFTRCSKLTQKQTPIKMDNLINQYMCFRSGIGYLVINKKVTDQAKKEARKIEGAYYHLFNEYFRR